MSHSVIHRTKTGYARERRVGPIAAAWKVPRTVFANYANSADAASCDITGATGFGRVRVGRSELVLLGRAMFLISSEFA
jgi:hypothetical protein